MRNVTNCKSFALYNLLVRIFSSQKGRYETWNELYEEKRRYFKSLANHFYSNDFLFDLFKHFFSSYFEK